MATRIASIIIVIMMLVSCTDKGRPDIVCKILGWEYEFPDNHDIVIVRYSLYNNGSSDDDKLKYADVWKVFVPYYIQLADGTKHYYWSAYPQEIFGFVGKCPDIGELVELTSVFTIREGLGSSYTNQTNLLFIENIVPEEPEIEKYTFPIDN